MALRLGKSLVASSVHDYVEVAEGISVLEVKATRDWHGKSLVETGIGNRFGFMVLAINRWNGSGAGRLAVIAPSGDDVIREGDTLVVFGPDAKLQAFERNAFADPQ